MATIGLSGSDDQLSYVAPKLPKGTQKRKVTVFLAKIINMNNNLRSLRNGEI